MQRTSLHSLHWLGLALLLLLGRPLGAAAQDAGSMSASQAPDAALAPDPKATQVHALLSNSLDVSIAPQALFEIPLGDEAALQIEATRVRALLRAVDEAQRAAESKTRGRSQDAGLGAELAALDPALWAQRLDLDRARLEFYSLPAEARAELLRAHAERREAAKPEETEQERRAREIAEERARALEAARVARSEAERAVSAELARLLALEADVHSVDEHLREMRGELTQRREVVLGWQRRARDAALAGPGEADATYDAIRKVLRVSRDESAAAIDALQDAHSAVPELGADPLVELPADVAADDARERRSAVQRAIEAARAEERAVNEERAAWLLDEIDALNRERLNLLSSLGSAKRNAITGFTAAGWDQARSEARHLSLIVRYHRYAARAWLDSLQHGGSSRWRAAGIAVPLLGALAAYLWLRRRSQTFLRWVELRLAAGDRAERRTTASIGRRIVRLVLKVHRPLEAALFFALTFWLLPSAARGLLEVQLLASAIGWVLAGAMIVNTVNAFAAAAGARSLAPLDDDASGRLRLRSLRLVGRTVVAFVLVLVLSARLVGEGTIYSWVFSTCWLASFPVFLLLVRWWRTTVFERLDRIRKKTPTQAWVLANRVGWKSFAAATLGALQLFLSGAVKLVRSWLSSFDLARRIHAYLFKREIERMGEGRALDQLSPLAAEVLERLHPEHAARRWLPCPSDGLRDELVARAAQRKGGVIAILGACGIGKTSLLRDLEAHVQGAIRFSCTARSSLSDLRAALSSAAELDSTDSSAPPLVLVDDVQRLVRPQIGGLERFDQLLAFARQHGERSTWVLAIDGSMWPLLKRARDARPLFDATHALMPWNEVQLGGLLRDRCEEAGIEAHYDQLLENLPAGADELDRQDALEVKRIGYERMLWDHVSGNPGLALEAWRRSLGRSAEGLVQVRPLQVPETATLERLSDSSLFVLRAVLQMAPTTVDAVAAATRLRDEDVLSEFRFGTQRGFYRERDGEVCVAWPWLRSVVRLLERRHLLVIS